jgi:hypothetical protein
MKLSGVDTTQQIIEIWLKTGETLFTLEFRSKMTQSEWNKSPLYVTRKFAGDNVATDLIITPTDGILQVFKRDPTELSGFEKMRVYPNPTMGETMITFKIYEKGFVTLGVYDMGGKKCIEVLNGTYSVGQYSTTVNLGMLSAGEYIAILRKDDELYSERTSVVK